MYKRLFIVMKSNLVNIKPDQMAYNAIISGFGKNGVVQKMEQTFDDMKSDHVKPDEVTYNSLIDCYGKIKDWRCLKWNKHSMI